MKRLLLPVATTLLMADLLNSIIKPLAKDACRMRIDSHQHFWQYHPVRDAWITDDMNVIQQNFLPPDLLPLLQQNNMAGSVAVQADQSEEETIFLLEQAVGYDFIKGVVGWVDCRADNIEERLDYFSQFRQLKGFRHIVQAEPEDDFLLRTDFCRGIAALSKRRFTYDILIFPKQLPAAVKFVQRFPGQAFVVDHLAKPNYKQPDFAFWEKNIRALAASPNVYCKISGMVTEADWKNWQQHDFRYCLDVVTAAFGTQRLLFGSDWPVCRVAATYKEVCTIVEDYYASFSPDEKSRIMGANAIAFYNL
jgi:L-fuconolactonase